MQQWIRKHRVLLGWIIFIGIAVPMLFFGVPAVWDDMGRGNKDEVIATVGGVPVYASAFRRSLNEAAERQRTMNNGERPTYQQLDESGEVEKVLQRLVDSALVQWQQQQRGFTVDSRLAVARMKEWPQFQEKDETTGESRFNAAAWNQFVREFDGNWNKIYSELDEQIARQVFVSLLSAPGAHVPPSEIEKQLLDNHTKLKIKAAKVDPPFEVSEEDIKQEYESNLEKYRNPESWVAEYVALSLKPEGTPQKALDAVARARAGEDFAALADELSDLQVKNGGDMGWQVPGTEEFEHRKPMFALGVGEVSDPVAGPGGYFVYRVDEERTNAETGAREVHARQIFVKADLSDAEKTALQDKARAISEQAKREGSLEQAAASHNLSIKKTGPFTRQSTEIEGIPRADAVVFRAMFQPDDPGKDYDLITGRENLYVAKIIERTPGEVPPLEEVRDRVLKDAQDAYRRTEPYKAKVKEYADKILAQCKNLEQAATLFPELKMEIKETDFFTRREFLFQQQIYLQPAQIYEKLGKAQPGTIAGPLDDFRGESFFVELVEKKEPTEEEKAEWADERKQIAESERRTRENDLLEDYVKYLHDNKLLVAGAQINQRVLDNILGRNLPASSATGADGAPAEGATPAEEAAIPVEAPAAETPAGAEAPAAAE